MFDLILPSSELTRPLRRRRSEPAATAATILHAAVVAIRQGIGALAAARARRRLRRKTVRELQSLSDRTLRDIGIPRSAIWAVADDLVNAVAGTAADGREPPQPTRPRLEPANRNQAQKRGQVPLPVAVGCG